MKYIILVSMLFLVIFLTGCNICITPTYTYKNYSLKIPYETSEFDICGIEFYINNISTKDISNVPYWYEYEYYNQTQEFIVNVKHPVNSTFFVKKICPGKQALIIREKI